LENRRFCKIKTSWRGLNAEYIQPIGFCVGIMSLVPVKPVDDKPKRLTKGEKEVFSLGQEHKDILIGLLLGDLHILKQCVNPSLTFKQGILHEGYLDPPVRAPPALVRPR
jgi:hypothetical protein